MAKNAIWITSCPLPNALAIATRTGQLSRAFAQLDVDVHLLRSESSEEIRLSHFRHTVPGQVRHGGHIPPLWSRAEGRDVRLLGLSWTRESQLVLVRGDSTLNSLTDLKGKRLALPVRSALPIDFWQATTLKAWTSLLHLAGLSLNEVELVRIPVLVAGHSTTHPVAAGQSGLSLTQGVADWTLGAQRQEAHALLNGEVDAIFSPAHYGATLRRFLGARILFDLTTAPNRDEWLNNATLLALTADGQFVDQHPEAIDDLLVTLLKSSQWASAHPSETARIVAAETGNPEELVEEIFGKSFANALTLTLSEDALDALDRQNRFLFENGFVQRIVPHEEWVDDAPLKKAASHLLETPV